MREFLHSLKKDLMDYCLGPILIPSTFTSYNEVNIPYCLTYLRKHLKAAILLVPNFSDRLFTIFAQKASSSGHYSKTNPTLNPSYSAVNPK